MVKRAPAHDEAGQILILTALSMTVLLGIAALSINAGFMFEKRNQLYAAADAGAKAGALELARNPAATNAILQRFAEREVANLGFTTGGTTRVTFNCPPIDGNFASGLSCGDSGYVQVTVSQDTSTFFGNILGVSFVTSRVWAVAGVVDSPTCILALSTTASGVLVSAGTEVRAPSCGVMANSPLPASIDVGGSLTARVVDVSGAPPDAIYTHDGGSITGVTNTLVPPFEDPLFFLPVPDADVDDCMQPPPPGKECLNTFDVRAGGCMHTAPVVLSGGPFTIGPGTYCGGITLNGVGTVTMSPGVYALYGGGLRVTNGSHVTGSEVMIFNTGTEAGTSPYGIDQIEFAGDPTSAVVSAPTVGTYAGILVYQSRQLTGGGFNAHGGVNLTMDGALYLPSSSITFDNVAAAAVSLLIGQSLHFTSGGVITVARGAVPFVTKTGSMAQ